MEKLIKKMSFAVMLAVMTGGWTPVKGPILHFDSEVHDFGKIPQGKPVSTRFRFTNRGADPLVIQSVEPSCGCTAAQFTREAVPHGHTGWIELSFDAAKVARFDKQAVVYSNSTTPVTVIYIRGVVVTK